MEQEPIILDSAHRHDVSNEAMLHALRYPVRHFVQDAAMTMFSGPDETGTLVDVGVVEWRGIIAIAHAMRPARSKYRQVNIMTPRSIDEIKARANEFAAWRRYAAERDLADAVHEAREQQLSWREVGEAIGASGEAARQR